MHEHIRASQVYLYWQGVGAEHYEVKLKLILPSEPNNFSLLWYVVFLFTPIYFSELLSMSLFLSYNQAG